MYLFSLVIEHGNRSYTTQVSALDCESAVRRYLTEQYPVARASAFGCDAPALVPDDIIYVVPMDGLTNAWHACVGREGEYLSLVCLRTCARSREL